MRFDRMKTSRTCRTCQDPFEDPGAGKRSAPAGFCSRKCADAATRERANRKASMRAVPPRAPLRLLSPSSNEVVCVTCGVVFEASQRDINRGRKFCSQKCMGLAKRRPLSAKCGVCGVAIDPGNPSKPRKACSEDCASILKARAKSGEGNPNFKGEQRVDSLWRSQAGEACVVCGDTTRLELHHVIYRQHVRAEGGNQWDPRDSLTVCKGCHAGHHHAIGGRITAEMLRDENYEFAEDLLGPSAAHLYLSRRYVGTDPRLERLGAWDDAA